MSTQGHHGGATLDHATHSSTCRETSGLFGLENQGCVVPGESGRELQHGSHGRLQIRGDQWNRELDAVGRCVQCGGNGLMFQHEHRTDGVDDPIGCEQVSDVGFEGRRHRMMTLTVQRFSQAG